MRKIFEGLLEVVIHFHSLKRVHGDIRPLYVSLTPQGDPILNDRLIDPRNPLRINYTHYKKRESLYIPPYLFNKFCDKSNDINIDLKKLEVFAVGMLILQTGLLHSVQDVYDRVK